MISILEGVDFPTFLVRLLLTVLFFYIIGIVVGIILYNAFPVEDSAAQEEQSEEGAGKENFEVGDVAESDRDDASSEGVSGDTELAENPDADAAVGGAPGAEEQIGEGNSMDSREEMIGEDEESEGMIQASENPDMQSEENTLQGEPEERDQALQAE